MVGWATMLPYGWAHRRTDPQIGFGIAKYRRWTGKHMQTDRKTFWSMDTWKHRQTKTMTYKYGSTDRCSHTRTHIYVGIQEHMQTLIIIQHEIQA